MALTKTEYLRKLSTDREFFINFMLNNNYPGISAKLVEMGYVVSTPEQAFKIIDGFIRTGNRQALLNVASVTYINDKTNDTGGLRNEASANEKLDLSFIPWVGDWITDQINDPGNIDAYQQQQLQFQQQQELAAQKNRNTWIIIAVVFLLLAAIVGGIIAYNNSKKRKAVKMVAAALVIFLCSIN